MEVFDVLQIGDRVVITSSTSKNKGKHATVGALDVGKNGYIGVYPDGSQRFYPNSEYKYGEHLLLKETSVRKIKNEDKKGEFEMDNITGHKLVAVIKQGNNDYHYALFDESVKKGDKVIVSGKAINNVFTVFEIITTEQCQQIYRKNITAEVICKVDYSNYEQRLEKRKQLKKLKEEMDKEVKKMQEIDMYEMYASKNENLAKLLEQYKSL